MRLEKITSKALQVTKNDRYLLSVMVAKRAEELSRGAKALVEVDKSVTRYVDIALIEIAQEKVTLEDIIDKE